MKRLLCLFLLIAPNLLATDLSYSFSGNLYTYASGWITPPPSSVSVTFSYDPSTPVNNIVTWPSGQKSADFFTGTISAIFSDGSTLSQTLDGWTVIDTNGHVNGVPSYPPADAIWIANGGSVAPTVSGPLAGAGIWRAEMSVNLPLGTFNDLTLGPLPVPGSWIWPEFQIHGPGQTFVRYVSTVPEPASLACLGSGLAMLVITIRRKPIR